MKDTVVVLPAYNAQQTLLKTVQAISKTDVLEIILVDDFSADKTVNLANSLGLKVFQHKKNLGYGANQKTCYKKALETKASIIVMLHPDYQYDPTLIPHLVNLIRSGYAEVMLGSRIRSRAESLAGGMPLYKYLGNRFLTGLENLCSGLNLSEWHTGMRAYSRKVLEDIDFEKFSNDFIFDTQMLFECLRKKKVISEIPVPVRYFKEASSINFIRSCRYGILTVQEALRYLLFK